MLNPVSLTSEGPAAPAPFFVSDLVGYLLTDIDRDCVSVTLLWSNDVLILYILSSYVSRLVQILSPVSRIDEWSPESPEPEPAWSPPVSVQTWSPSEPISIGW